MMWRTTSGGTYFSLKYALVISVIFIHLFAGCINNKSTDPLTAEERAWLSEHDGKIKLAHDPNVGPVDYLDEEGNFQGIAADYVRLIEKHLNFKFDIVHFKTWDEVLRKAKSREVDVLCAFSKNKERGEYMLFTAPYITIPTVILTRDSFKGDLALETMKDRKVTFTKGWIVDHYLRQHFNHLIMLPAIDSDAALNNLIAEKADAWVTPLTIASIKIEAHKVTNIRIAGKTEFSFELAMASRKDWPMLNTILEKGLARISEDERTDIFNKWIHIKQESIYESRIFWLTLLAIGGSAALTVMIVFFWNMTLKRKVAEKTDALQRSEKKYRDLVELAQEGIWLIDKDDNTCFVNPSMAKILGYGPDEMIGRSLFSFMDEKSREKAQWHLKRRKTGIKEQHDFQFVHKNGRRVYTTMETAPIMDNDGNYDGAIAGVIDITERQEAQLALQERTEALNQAQKVAQTGSWRYDPKTQIPAWTEEMFRIFGLEPQPHAVPFKDHRSIIHPEDWDRFDKAVTCAITEGSGYDIDLRVTRPDGEIRHVNSRCIARKDDDGAVMELVGTAQDITERKLIEEHLERYKDIVSSTTDCIAFLDDNYTYIIVNGAYEKFSGFDLNHFIGLTVSEYLGEAVFEELIKPNFDRCLHGEIVNFQECFTYPLLGERFMDITYSPYRDRNNLITGVIANTRDITDRKKAEEEIARQKRLFETMFNTIPDGVVVTNTRREILLANKGMETTFDYKQEDLQGKSTEILYSDQTRFRNAGTAVFNAKAQKPDDLYVTRYRRKDGSEFSGETFGAKLFDENHRWIGNLGIMRDITEREKAELRIQQAQRMESIGNLAGGIAHDFNNLLFPIVGMSELLLEDLPPGSQEYENAEEILRAGRRSSDLVKQILAFSRQVEHKLIPVRIQKVLKEVLKLTRATIPSYIELHQDIQSDCGLVMADATQIHQVAMNIITNAFHAVESEGGTISVQLKETALKGDEWPDSPLSPGRYAALSISDTGIGMSKDLTAKIFEPYFTTKEQGKGTGLGLAVVYGIIKEHKGDIKVYSEIGKGTTFTAYLPLMDKPGDTRERAGRAPHPHGSEKILLVDDEPSIAKLEKQMLERLGYKVTSRLNSIEALEAFKAKPDEFDLVLTDMAMPNLTGDQLARELKAIRPDIPIIICTGYSERINREIAVAIGVKGFLMKPIVKSDMAGMLRKVLDGGIGATPAK